MLCIGRQNTLTMTNIALESFTTQYQNGDNKSEAKVKGTAIHSDIGKA
jgi:hypothetical protein